MADSSPDPILHYYQRGLEAERLVAGVGELERVRTQEIILRYLQPPPARILDLGGGPGAYSAWLLERGYQVDLIDPVALHIEQARQRFAALRLHATATLGDARAIDAADDSYDAVLVLGPLYHLTERGDRLRALRETRRVLRSHGVGLVAVISRFASLLDGFSRSLISDPVFVSILTRDLEDGQHRNTGDSRYFTTAFFHRPEDIESEIREAGLDLEAILAVEGPFWHTRGFDELWTNRQSRELMLEMLRRVESEPTMLGTSAHLLAIARKVEGKGEVEG